MSDTQSNSVAFVRHNELPPAPPPSAETGAVKWMRENLFSGVLSSVLTVVSVALVVWGLLSVGPWVLNGVWITGNLRECREYLNGSTGACWSVLSERWNQLLFGFQYPVDQYWRPTLAFVLLFVCAAPVLFRKLPRKLLIATILYPFFAYWLIWGGAFWQPILIFFGFVITIAVFRAVLQRSSESLALFAAVAVFLLWFIYGLGFVTSGIDRTMSAARMDGKVAELQELAAQLPSEIEQMEAEATHALDQMNAALEAARATDDIDVIRAAYHDVADVRFEQRELGRELGVLKADLSGATRLLNNIDRLETLEEMLPELSSTAETSRDALPETVSLVLDEDTLDALSERNRDLDLGIPEADLERAAEAIKAESAVRQAEQIIARTHADVARIGLEPVASRKMGGFMLNMILGTVCVALSIPLGIGLALGRQSNLPIIKGICVVFIEFVRGVPLITLLFVANVVLAYFFPPGSNLDLILRVIIMITMFSAAYIAEVIRGGLAALPKGQYEAGDSLGLDYAQSMRLIILPQALKISIPGIVNVAVGLFKDTTLVSVISMFDLVGMMRGPVLSSTAWTGIYWEVFLFAIMLFFVVCYGISQYSQWLERQLATDHR